MLERKIDFMSILTGGETSLHLLRKDKYEEVFAFALMCARNYLEYAYPNQVNLAAQFALDLIETRPTWKLADVVNLFKTFRQRQDLEGLKVMGNTMTGQKLMEMVGVYEELRAIEHEKVIAIQQGEHREQNRYANQIVEKLGHQMRDKGIEPTGDAVLGKEMEAQRSRTAQHGAKPFPKVDHNTFFEPKK